MRLSTFALAAAAASVSSAALRPLWPLGEHGEGGGEPAHLEHAQRPYAKKSSINVGNRLD